jgi:hypothetical protein
MKRKTENRTVTASYYSIDLAFSTHTQNVNDQYTPHNNFTITTVIFTTVERFEGRNGRM